MSRFSYSAVVEGGQRVSGTVRCADRRTAVQQLISKGFHPLTLEPADQRSGGVGRLWRRLSQRVTTTDLAVFTRQLAALLKAGILLVPAMMTLKRQSENRRLIQVIDEVIEVISHEGVQLADALEDHPTVFSPIYCNLVRAGEEGGNVVEVLDNLAQYLGQSARLRGQVIGAFVYPAFLFVLGVTAVFILMSFVIPRFQELFVSFGHALPMPTQILISVSGFLSAWWPAVLLTLIAAVAGLTLALRHAVLRERYDRFLLKLPVLGRMFLKLEMARIARTLGALLKGGVKVLMAIRITGQTVRNQAVKRTFLPIVDRIAGGGSLGAAMEEAKVYPALVINLVRTGEETGQLSEMLTELSRIYEDEAERAVSGAVKLLEPLLIVSMGIVIASIIAAVMLPIFQVNLMVE